MGGFKLDDRGITELWLRLKRAKHEVSPSKCTRIPGQRSTPRSVIDHPSPHAWVLVIVIPNFGLGSIGFDGAYPSGNQVDGWQKPRLVSGLLFYDVASRAGRVPRLMRDEFGQDIPDERLLGALTGTSVALVADGQRQRSRRLHSSLALC